MVSCGPFLYWISLSQHQFLPGRITILPRSPPARLDHSWCGAILISFRSLYHSWQLLHLCCKHVHWKPKHIHHLNAIVPAWHHSRYRTQLWEVLLQKIRLEDFQLDGVLQKHNRLDLKIRDRHIKYQYICDPWWRIRDWYPESLIR